MTDDQSQPPFRSNDPSAPGQWPVGPQGANPAAAPGPAYPPGSPPERGRRWMPWLIVGAAVLALCCGGGAVLFVASGGDDNDTPSSAEQADPAAPDEPPAETEAPADVQAQPATAGYGAGVWEVGTEIPTGTYVTTVPAGVLDMCYWARLAGFSGDVDELIANGTLASGARGRFTVVDGDAGVEFSGECQWVDADEAGSADPGSEIGDGVWAVGDEIQPGTYTSTAPDGEMDLCYWARLVGFSGEAEDLIANSVIEGGARGRVEISDSDAGVEFSGGCVWTRD
jgi:hypothetical protein